MIVRNWKWIGWELTSGSFGANSNADLKNQLHSGRERSVERNEGESAQRGVR
jgi:hypothetical protein